MEYPKCLYRDGSAFEWEGHKLDGIVVNDKEEEAEAVKAGWRTNPLAEAVKAVRGRKK
ncbi:hypothetical protein L7H23_01195 [Sphingopyxis sp. BSN-002]|uniref:hypothetical protein n=1 Tax=Sphingopyxis sp. BSN-002 TaxID=2911495 RepID=UPI001EDC5316|nr:hypothetical protein [Sphingopyxis sp. BSN-002]UKK84749.1 hypothetical protein L7H23_01195 [Sphingopyxis sp. BSN-002]